MTQSTPRLPIEGEGWRHVQGGLYRIVGIGYDTRDGAALVIYQGCDHHGDDLWARPVSDFLGWTDDKRRRFVFEREPGSW